MISKRKAKARHGFTIIELMISVFVVTLAIVGFVGANVMAQRNAEEMHERTIALQNANRVLEEMRSATKVTGFPQNVTNGFPQNGFVSGFTDLTNEQVQVSYVNPTADPLDVQVTVSWLSYAHRQQSETVRTYITQR